MLGLMKRSLIVSNPAESVVTEYYGVRPLTHDLGLSNNWVSEECGSDVAAPAHARLWQIVLQTPERMTGAAPRKGLDRLHRDRSSSSAAGKPMP
jgi:hypothetical protein